MCFSPTLKRNIILYKLYETSSFPRHVSPHKNWYINWSYKNRNWSYINGCISDFVSNSYNQDVFIVGCTIQELCISRGEEHCLFNMYELEEFIKFLST